MILVTVELKSAISKDRDRLLGRIVICNEGGTATRGDYNAAFYGPNDGAGRVGTVKDYPRKAVAIWNLVRRACEAAGYTK